MSPKIPKLLNPHNIHLTNPIHMEATLFLIVSPLGHQKYDLLVLSPLRWFLLRLNCGLLFLCLIQNFGILHDSLQFSIFSPFPCALLHLPACLWCYKDHIFSTGVSLSNCLWNIVIVCISENSNSMTNPVIIIFLFRSAPPLNPLSQWTAISNQPRTVDTMLTSSLALTSSLSL